MPALSAKKLSQLSHRLSRILRHRANEEGLALDSDNWCRLSDLLRLDGFENITQADIQDIVNTSVSNDGPRFELQIIHGLPKIRATRKHTITKVSSAPDTRGKTILPQSGKKNVSGSVTPQYSESVEEPFKTRNGGRELQWSSKPNVSRSAVITLGDTTKLKTDRNRFSAFGDVDSDTAVLEPAPSFTPKCTPDAPTPDDQVSYKNVRYCWDPITAMLDDTYMPLNHMDRVRQTLIEEGWAYGDVLDSQGNILRSGWYPPTYLQVLKTVLETWDASGSGSEYMSIVKGDLLWEVGRVEVGWELGEISDEHGNTIRKGWYPALFAMVLDQKVQRRQQEAQQVEHASVHVVEEYNETPIPPVVIEGQSHMALASTNHHNHKTSKSKKKKKQKEIKCKDPELWNMGGVPATASQAENSTKDKHAELEKKCMVQDALIQRLLQELKQESHKAENVSAASHRVENAVQSAEHLTAQPTSLVPKTGTSTHSMNSSSPLHDSTDDRRTKQADAADKRAVNAPAAERGGGSGISSGKLADVQRRAKNDNMRGRFEEAQRARGSDVGAAGMFMQAKSVNPETLARYINHYSPQNRTHAEVLENFEEACLHAATIDSLKHTIGPRIESVATSSSDVPNIDHPSSEDDPDIMEAKRRSMLFGDSDSDPVAFADSSDDPIKQEKKDTKKASKQSAAQTRVHSDIVAFSDSSEDAEEDEDFESDRLPEVGDRVRVFTVRRKDPQHLLFREGTIQGIFPDSMSSEKACSVSFSAAIGIDSEVRTLPMCILQVIRSATKSHVP